MAQMLMAGSPEGGLAADPHRDERTIGREPQHADVGVDELVELSAREIVELAGADLRDPHVDGSVAVG